MPHAWNWSRALFLDVKLCRHRKRYFEYLFFQEIVDILIQVLLIFVTNYQIDKRQHGFR